MHTVTMQGRETSERRKWLAAWALAAFALHSVLFFQFASGDVIMFVVPWYDHIMAAGRIAAFAHPFSNYSPPYLYLLSATSLFDGTISPYYLVKTLSWVGVLWMLLAASRLLEVVGGRPVLALSLVLLPSIIANVSMLGQADTFWVAPCLLAVAASVRARWFWVAFWSGLAFAFKAQAAFFAPFVVHLFVTRRVPLHIWLVAPAVYVAAMFPAWLAGWPAWDLTMVYLRQAMWQPNKPPFYFISNGASWWTIYGWFFPRLALHTFWVGFVLAFVAIGSAIAFVPRLTTRTTILLAILSSAGIPFLLPGMHERFYILGDVLAVLYASVYPSRRSIAAALFMQFASAFPVFVWAFQMEPLQLLAPPFAVVALYLFFKELAEPAELTKRLADYRPYLV